ncbi:MAG TPA: hypothetical protein EYP04_08835 [Anaerolineae bacterium]|nr:hypothetical protein [Anaerolineae bacterium]
MGCGPDVFRLFDLADALVRDNRARRCETWPAAGSPQHPGPSLQEQLYEMYERGELDEKTFRELKDLAARGRLQPVDLAVLRYERQQRIKTRPRVSEEDVAIRKLRARIARLEEAREESSQVLASLRERIADMEARAQQREEGARQVVATDEALARRYLMEKQELVEAQARLEAQAQALEEDLARLDELRGKLEAKVAELEALRSRRELQSLRTEVT